MSTITDTEIRSLARLARLALSDEEVSGLSKDLSGILEHMEKLSEVDTTGVEPMTHAMPMQRPLRPDRVEESLPRSLAMAMAPASDGESFEVPSILPSGGDS